MSSLLVLPTHLWLVQFYSSRATYVLHAAQCTSSSGQNPAAHQHLETWGHNVHNLTREEKWSRPNRVELLYNTTYSAGLTSLIGLPASQLEHKKLFRLEMRCLLKSATMAQGWPRILTTVNDISIIHVNKLTWWIRYLNINMLHDAFSSQLLQLTELLARLLQKHRYLAVHTWHAQAVMAFSRVDPPLNEGMMNWIPCGILLP